MNDPRNGIIKAMELKAENERMREVIQWAAERLEVDYGMTPKEQATTARRLRSASSPKATPPEVPENG